MRVSYQQGCLDPVVNQGCPEVLKHVAALPVGGVGVVGLAWQGCVRERPAGWERQNHRQGQ